jgi:branched-chain amino acid transport system substrate-binding protein
MHKEEGDTMKRLFALIAVGLVLMAGQCPTGPAGPAFEPPADEIGVVTIKPGEPIHIAAWFVIAGPDAQLGTDTQYGVELAIDDKGGKILDHDIKLTVEDEGCNPEGGQASATKIAADPTVVAAIGSNCSSAAKAGVPILWQAGIATVSPSNTAVFLTATDRSAEYDGYLRTAHNDKVQGSVAADFAYNQLKLTKAATIHDGSVYAEQLQQVFVNRFKELGGTITAQEAVAPTDTDMKPVLTKIAATSPELLYSPIFTAAAGHVTRQSKEVSGLEDIALMSADGAFSPDFYKGAGEAAIGMYHSSPDFSVFGDAYTTLREKYEAKYGTKPLAPFHAHAYDAAMIVFAAIEKVGVKGPDGSLYIGRKALRDALFAIKDFKGMTGNVTCDQYGDCADPHIAVYKTEAGNITDLVMPSTPFWKPY